MIKIIRKLLANRRKQDDPLKTLVNTKQQELERRLTRLEATLRQK